MRRARDDYPYFVKHIFSQSTDILKHGEWTHGDFIDDIAGWLGSNPKTIRVSAKDHFKSMSFYSHIMWKILRLAFTHRSREINYFSYKQMMAAYHIGKIKTAVECNPYFKGVIDLKAVAEGAISYSWDGDHVLTVTAKGLLEFKRGIHCPDVYVDDPLQDPENKMVPTKITRINDVIKNQILDMAQEEMHVVGTAQTNTDFFFDQALTSRFSVRILPAIVNEKEHITLWPEWMDYEELMAKKKERGEKVFNQEYLCSPVYAENAFFSKERLMTVVNPLNKNYSFTEWEEEIKRREEKEEVTDWDKIGAWDLGKKGHPAHFSVFEKRFRGKMDKEGERIYERVQIHDHWFDHVDYSEQMQHIDHAIDVFGIDQVFFDATRGEMEMAQENGELRGEYEPVVFTHKSKHSMATEFDKAVTNKSIELLNIPRSINQMLIVDNDLQAPTTPEGHADSFQTACMSFRDMESAGADIHFV